MECQLQTFFPFSRRNATLTTNAHEWMSQWLAFLFALVLFLTLSLLVGACLPPPPQQNGSTFHHYRYILCGQKVRHSLRIWQSSWNSAVLGFAFTFKSPLSLLFVPRSFLLLLIPFLGWWCCCWCGPTVMGILGSLQNSILREFQGQQTPLLRHLLILFRTLPNQRLVINKINGRQLPNLRASPFKLDPCGKQIRLPRIHNCSADVLFPLCSSGHLVKVVNKWQVPLTLAVNSANPPHLPPTAESESCVTS